MQRTLTQKRKGAPIDTLTQALQTTQLDTLWWIYNIETPLLCGSTRVALVLIQQIEEGTPQEQRQSADWE